MITFSPNHLVVSLKLIAVAFGAILISSSVFLVIYANPFSVNAQGSESSFTGYAWSDTIGWVSFSGSGYGLSIDSEGAISGYAWSDNVGWISANSSDLSGCPSSPCSASIDSDGEFQGWFRVISGGSSQSGGWDGFISLSGSNYGPAISSDGNVSGYAWGDTNVGWLSFSGDGYAVSTDYASEPTAELMVRIIGDEEWQSSVVIEPTEEVELAWNQDSTANTESCHSVPPAHGFSTEGETSGTDSDVEEPVGNDSYTYRLLCYGDGEETQVDDLVTVETIGGEGAQFCPGTKIDFARRDTDVDLCWELGTNNPDLCSLKAGETTLKTPLATPGEFTYRLIGEVTFALECTGGDSDEMTVKVLPEVQET